MAGRMTFGAMLREDRERIGLGQAAMARALGVSPGAVCRWEGGSRYPDNHQIIKLMEQVGAPATRAVAWLRAIPRLAPFMEAWDARKFSAHEIIGDLARRARTGVAAVS